jgi:dTDP-4-dehydrorhamnose 3,5-epimerase
MQIRELEVPFCYEVTPRQFPDDRGRFWEFYRFDRLEEALGHPLRLAQGNASISRKGVVRGVHFAELRPGQAKYVTCFSGAVLDFAVDIRIGSPTFGTWDTVLLDGVDRRAIYLAEGVGHAFVALTDEAVVSYLVSSVFDAPREHGVNPVDPELALDFGLPADDLVLSEKDTSAPGLAAAAEAGLLPTWEDALRYYQELGR